MTAVPPSYGLSQMLIITPVPTGYSKAEVAVEANVLLGPVLPGSRRIGGFNPVLFAVLVPMTLFGCGASSTSSDPGGEVPASQSPVTSITGTGKGGTTPYMTGEARVAPTETPRSPTKADWFEDVTLQCGVNFTYRNGREGEQFTVIETIGGGVAMLDYDQDGDLDLFITGGGTIEGTPPRFGGLPSALYRNDGDWKFVDVTREAGLAGPIDYSMGCAVADYNRDGNPDLLVTCFGRSRLFRNTGRGGFVDATNEAGLTVDGCSTSAAWADVDRDGWPDLYVTGYVKYDAGREKFCGDRVKRIRDACGPWTHVPARHHLLRNRADGTFEDISQPAGIMIEGKGLGVVALDLNGDGWIDFHVTNDAMANFLYLGGPGPHFDERGLLSGTAYDQNGIPQGSMGVDAADYDGDGDPDLFVTNYEMEENSLYRNEGGGFFRLVTAEVGLAGQCRPYVGFGTGFVDFDSDGWLDLAVLNGHVLYSTGELPHAQPAFLFRNLNGRRFEDASTIGGPFFGARHVCRGAAFGDLDNDGAPDAVIVRQNQPVVILRNRLPAKHGWMRVHLRGTTSEPNAVGAVVSTYFQGRNLVRHVRGGGSYLSHSDQHVLFPIENDQPKDVRVTWLGGRSEVFHNVKVRETTTLIEGAGESEDK